ncbi:selenium cofactor biosynthesis protein YqeC [Cloacibacillus sp.]|uniref:selenium cofactor biosynthesis protein YqeC n=1 Tax=Cloacibacillus sp. TaxID=2049023 RepID=UPI0025BC7B97|nr:selenium cofactor biosynthesis protein YqeC [Cloacibacillus sp.]MCC8057516.1 putative selenium-dependent hydroxylase accessory protein YqeC [Cloacibacillus sp.]
MREIFSFLAEYIDKNKITLAAITGGGGKTSLLYGLGRELAASRRALLTTTTKIFRPTPGECRDLFVGPARLCLSFLEAMPHASLLTAASGESGGKLLGYTPEEIERLADCGAAVIAECDGSRGRPLKFYEAWEPPVPQGCGCLFAVAGAGALGERADKERIFRAGKFRALHNIAEGAKITAANYLSYLSHAEGPLKNAPRGAKKILLLNQWETCGEDSQAALAGIIPALLESYDAAACVSMRRNILYDYRER